MHPVMCIWPRITSESTPIRNVSELTIDILGSCFFERPIISVFFLIRNEFINILRKDFVNE